ncbi:MAG: hypothetical protein HUU50_06030 [Candidatus Brocadiae bacterium]|nr:hypothetical protein [Candidatus Brocadiia bacterium]
MKKPLENLLTQAKKRRRVQIALQSFCNCVFFFSILFFLTIVFSRFLYPVLNLSLVASVLFFASVLFCMLKTFLYRITKESLALDIDKACKLEERISSALCVPEHFPIKDALEQDASQFIDKMDLSLVFPYKNQKVLLASLVSILFCIVALYAMPEQDIFQWGKKAREKQHLVEEKKQIASQIQKKIDMMQEKIAQHPFDPNLKSLMMDIKKFQEQLEKNSLENLKEEIAQVNSLLEKIEKFKENKIGEMSRINPQMQKKLNPDELHETKEMAKALQEKKFSKAAEEMKKIQKEMEKILSKKKLKKKLTEEDKKKIQKLQEELEKIAKAASQNKELQKTLEELSKQLEKMQNLDNLSSKEAQDLEKEMQKMESLQEQWENLQQMAEQLKAMEEMYQTLKENRDKMLETGTCPICGKKRCPICGKTTCGHGDACEGHKPEDFLTKDGGGNQQNGNNPGLKPGVVKMPGLTGGLGQGQGGKVEESPANDNKWNTVKLQGNKFEGKTIAEFQFRELGPKGESKISYKEYASEMSQEATSGLSEHKIPKTYHDYVKKYFEDVTQDSQPNNK